MTTREDIKNWLTTLKNKQCPNATHMIVATDTYNYEDFPVFVDTTEDVNKVINDYTSEERMLRVMEVYNFSLDIESQLNEHRAYHI